MGGVHGTGVAAGVAQSALQAQQLARQRDKQVRDAKRLAQHQLEVQRIRVEGLEEADAAEDATRIRIDNQVPEHEHRELPEVRRRRAHHHEPGDSAALTGLVRLLGRLPLRVDTSGLTARAPRATPPEPSARLAAVYHQHNRRPTGKSKTPRLDIEG